MRERRECPVHLSDIVLQQLQNKEGEASVADGGVPGDDVVAGLAEGGEDVVLPLYGPVVVTSLSETLESHHRAVPHSHRLVDDTTTTSSDLESCYRLQIVEIGRKEHVDIKLCRVLFAYRVFSFIFLLDKIHLNSPDFASSVASENVKLDCMNV